MLVTNLHTELLFVGRLIVCIAVFHVLVYSCTSLSLLLIFFILFFSFVHVSPCSFSYINFWLLFFLFNLSSTQLLLFSSFHSLRLSDFFLPYVTLCVSFSYSSFLNNFSYLFLVPCVFLLFTKLTRLLSFASNFREIDSFFLYSWHSPFIV